MPSGPGRWEKTPPRYLRTVLLLLCTSEVKGLCPYSDNDPCQCSFSDTVTITCRWTDVPRIEKMLEKFKNASLGLSSDDLIVQGSDLTTPHRGLLKSNPVRSLHLINSSVDLSHLGDMLRVTRDRLTYLQLRKCLFVGPPLGWTLGNLPYVKRLAVTESHLDTERTSSILQSSLTNLEEVYLYQNQIEHLQNWTLSHSKKLAVAVFNGNKIKEVYRSTFPSPAKELREIHLRDNLLRNLPKDLFSRMPQLRLVDVSRNSLVTLSETTWRPVWPQLKDVYVHDNPLQCDCQILWLAEEEKALPRVKKFERLFYGTCQSPIYLHSKHLQDINLSDLPC